MARGVCPMCRAEFVADAPYREHFREVHGLADDPGTETRLPEDPPPLELESEAEPAKKRRAWGGRASTDAAPLDNLAGAVPLAHHPPATEPEAVSSPVPVPVREAAEMAGAEPAAASVPTGPEPVVVIPPAEPEPEPPRPRSVRVVTVAGAVVVLVAFLLAAAGLTGDDEPARASAVPPPSVSAPAVPPPSPPAPAGEQYVVRPGDSLSKIAARVGVTVDALVAANGVADRNLIYVGQVLSVPR